MAVDPSQKKALITGIAGQDGTYLKEFLLEKGYDVHGVLRPASVRGLRRARPENQDAQKKVSIHEGDLSDSEGIRRIVQRVQPDEIYNLAAQSQVAVSFE